MALEPQRMEDVSSIVDVVDRVLDKGLVINADIKVALAGVELLEIKIRAALASFETAAKYGLELPSGTDTTVEAWQAAKISKEDCPQCKKRVAIEVLVTDGCPWCGWKSLRADALKATLKKGFKKK